MSAHAYPHADALARQIVAGEVTADIVSHALDQAFREGRSVAIERCRRAVATDRAAADRATNRSDRERLRGRADALSAALTQVRHELLLTDPEASP